MCLVAKRPHNQYESAIFVRLGSMVLSTDYIEEDSIENLTVELAACIVNYSVLRSCLKWKTKTLNFWLLISTAKVILGVMNMMMKMAKPLR